MAKRRPFKKVKQGEPILVNARELESFMLEHNGRFNLRDYDKFEHMDLMELPVRDAIYELKTYSLETLLRRFDVRLFGLWARAFKDALDEYEGQFNEIVFAIYHTPEEIDNYETFRRVFMSDEKQNKTKKKSTGYIAELDEGEIFVFGSNGMGRIWVARAATAVAKFGAIYGQAEGLQGQSYAINTMNGFEVMAEQVARFIEFAREHLELTFYVTEIGCGIAGYLPEEVAPLFKDVPENVVLSEAFMP